VDLSSDRLLMKFKTDVSGLLIGHIFKGQDVQEYFDQHGRIQRNMFFQELCWGTSKRPSKFRVQILDTVIICRSPQDSQLCHTWSMPTRVAMVVMA
jgi:hypothetical protein